jgi:hypothetical protein
MDRKTRTTLPGGAVAPPAAEEFLKLGEAQTQAMLDVQNRLLGVYEEIGRAWLARVKSETELWSELVNKIQEARSVPDALGAYQQGMVRRLQMAVDDGRRLAEDNQRLMSVMTQLASTNGPAEHRKQ